MCLVVGMCNPRDYSETPPTSKSTVEDLHAPIPSLFRALTEGETPINMMVVSFPVSEELSHHESLISFLESLDQQPRNVSLHIPGLIDDYDKGTLYICKDLKDVNVRYRGSVGSTVEPQTELQVLCLFALGASGQSCVISSVRYR